MGWILEEWRHGFSPEALEEMAALWNANAVGRHAFYPWTGGRLSTLLSADGKGLGKIIAARNAGGELLGWTHVSLMDEMGYVRAGVVEMLLVGERFRHRGIGTDLLRAGVELLQSRRPRPILLDALGAWPYGCVYNTLADGSERSGVFLSEAGLYRLFRRAGFAPVRKSLVMRAETKAITVRPEPPGSVFVVSRRRETTWLDRVFRGRELWDHILCNRDGGLLSRAIFGLMEGESRAEGRVIYSLFGVNTSEEARNRGYATANLSRLMAHVAKLGGEVMELHVYADNLPARALYRGLGFVELAETMMMHKQV